MDKPTCICNSGRKHIKQFVIKFGCAACYRLYDPDGRIDLFSVKAPYKVRKRVFDQIEEE